MELAPADLNRNVFCLYFKVYMPPEEQSAFLASQIRALVKEHVGPGKFEYFFFLRYNDPENHVRVRFFGDRAAVLGRRRAQLLEDLRTYLLPHQRLVVDKYRPEWSRYGGKPGVRFAERVFHASSAAVLDFLALQSEVKCSKVEFAMSSGEAMLESLGLDYETRQEFFGRHNAAVLPDGFLAQFQSLFEELVPAPRRYWIERLAPLHALTDGFCSSLEAAARVWPDIKTEVGKPLTTLADSYLHMHLNRLALFPKEEHILRQTRRAYAVNTRAPLQAVQNG